MAAGRVVTSPAPTVARVRRVPVVDEYVEDGRSAVLLDGRALTLSELPTLVLALLGDGWTELAALVPRVEELVGSPEGGTVTEALTALLTDLAEHGLVELD